MTAPYTAPLFDDLPGDAVDRRAHRAPLPQPEGRSAQYWSEQMLLAGADRARADYCYFMMMAALLALDRSGDGH